MSPRLPGEELRPSEESHRKGSEGLRHSVAQFPRSEPFGHADVLLSRHEPHPHFFHEETGAGRVLVLHRSLHIHWLRSLGFLHLYAISMLVLRSSSVRRFEKPGWCRRLCCSVFRAGNEFSDFSQNNLNPQFSSHLFFFFLWMSLFLFCRPRGLFPGEEMPRRQAEPPAKRAQICREARPNPCG